MTVFHIEVFAVSNIPFVQLSLLGFATGLSYFLSSFQMPLLDGPGEKYGRKGHSNVMRPQVQYVKIYKLCSNTSLLQKPTCSHRSHQKKIFLPYPTIGKG